MLFALTLSFAESAVASVCAESMMNTAAASSDGMAAMPDMPAEHDCAGKHSHDGESGQEPAAECPFAPAGAANGCTFSASIPASAVVEPVPNADRIRAAVAADTEPHSFLASSLFHPPKP
ncbi:MAG: hypothetical protein ACT443_15140 [Gemmatimonadota bacterium]